MQSKVEINIIECPERLAAKSLVTVKTCGNVLETYYLSHRNHGCGIRKLDKDRYCLLSTGEVRYFEHGTSRKDDLNGVRSSLRRLRDYINTNVTRLACCRWVTLTYAENMTDTARLYVDFLLFVKRLHYAFGDFEYIVAAEPQGRGAWHMHLLLIFPDLAPYIPNKELAAIWQQGFVKVKKLDKVDNVGAYLTAYLGDIETTEDAMAQVYELSGGNDRALRFKTVEERKNGKKLSKSLIKGGRLYLYPIGFHMYRMSKGIKQPTREVITERELQERTEGLDVTYQKAIQLLYEKETDKGAEFVVMVIFYRYYNLLHRLRHTKRRLRQ